MSVSHQLESTICAISSGSEPSAIAVIRLTGKQAIEIANKIFKTDRFLKAAARTQVFVKIIDPKNGEMIDEALVCKFIAPNSYTAEDLVEIMPHGSTYIKERILQLLIENGAHLASKGAFTKRAFLNGKLDLAQAEAVADLISSKHSLGHKLALKQMRGGFSNKINELKNKLIDFASLLELELDFSEEDVEFANRTQLKESLVQTIDYTAKLKESFRLGNVLKKGIPVAIVGAPNVGKSTLLNTLLGHEKAIVTNIAGTTRDAIEDEFNINGVLFRMIDTAGIRTTEDKVEQIGIEKTYEKLRQASIVLNLKDHQNDFAIDQNHLEPHQECIDVINKIDIKTAIAKGLHISAQTNQGIDALKSALYEASGASSLNNHDLVITNQRHFESLEKTSVKLQDALNGLSQELSSDLIALSMRSALHHISEITGEISTDDLLSNIFSRFCIGK